MKAVKQEDTMFFPVPSCNKKHLYKRYCWQKLFWFHKAAIHHLSQVQWKDSWIKSFQPHLQSVKMAQCNQLYHHQWCHSRHPQFTWLSHKGYQHITKHQFQCHQTLCKQGWIHFQTLDFQIKRFEYVTQKRIFLLLNQWRKWNQT